jgi:FkbH-like protein
MNESSLNILGSLGTHPTMAKTLAVASKLDRMSVDQTIVRFAVVRNITLEPGLPAALKVRSAQRGLRAIVQIGDFDASAREVFDPNSFLYEGRPDIIVVALQLRTFTPRLVLDFAALTAAEIADLVDGTLQRITALVNGIRERSSSVILVHNFELPLVAAFGILDSRLERGQVNVIRGLNTELARRMNQAVSCFVVDIDHLLAQGGYEASIDDRYWHIGRSPYTFSFAERLASEYVKFAAALKGKNKKCLVLDCDNTLWGGVVGEDGLTGIALGETYPGSAFMEFQSVLLDLYHRGILLAINSKNNPADVAEVLENHPSSLLRPSHFVSMKINWTDKVTNLREIAADLNIGLDSLVFADDSAFECQFVRESLPEVAVIELPSDATRYARTLRASGYFDTLALNDEDRRRSEMYRSQTRRSELAANSGSMEEYLASLDMIVTIASATGFSIPRIAQLTQKTNQFNLTTRRYSESEIARNIADPSWRVYYAELEDKFDQAGIVAAALVHDAARVSRIDTFVMSCRVIGRGVEQALLARIARESAELGQETLVGEFIPTAKNEIVRDFYETAGLAGRPGCAGQWWDLTLEQPWPSAPRWFREIRSAGKMVGHDA